MWVNLSVKVLDERVINSNTFLLLRGGGRTAEVEGVDESVRGVEIVGFSMTVAAASSGVSTSGARYSVEAIRAPSLLDASLSGTPNNSSRECSSLPHAVPARAML